MNNNMKNLAILTNLLLLLCLTACSDDNETYDNSKYTKGTELVQNNMELADTVLTLSHEADTATINTGGTGWWIESVTLKQAEDETTTNLTEADKAAIKKGENYNATFGWLKVNCSNGVMILTVSGNEDVNMRTFEIRLAAEGKTATVTGNQNGLPTGEWPDMIGLSAKDVEMECWEDTAYIETEGRSWWINSIELNGEVALRLSIAEKEQIAETGTWRAECDWLTVECNGYRIMTAVKDNFGDKRTFRINMQCGDWYDAINGTQKDRLAGPMDDNIQLSPKEMHFTAGGGTLSATTQSDSWSVGSIKTDGEYTTISVEERMACEENGVFEKTADWLTVKRSGRELHVTAAPNTTGKERTFQITVSHGNVYNYLLGTQAAD